MTIKQIQQALKAAGFDPGPIDGIKGPKTIAAIKAFQAANGLVVDGIVGPKTTAALTGGGGATGAAPASSAPTIDEQTLAAQYGFAMAVLNSDPELKALFQRAVSGTYTQERFTAELRTTHWYQDHSETWRNAQVLKTADPASYNANLAQVKTRLAMMAAQMGAVMTDAQLAQMAESSYQLGWDDNQIEQNLSTYIQYTDGRLLGQAGQWDQQLREYAQNMGVQLSDETIANYVKAAAAGTATIDDQMGKIRNIAISAFPHLADRLRAGETLADIASPYQQAMASTLELNPQGLTVADPTIQRALTARDDKGQAVMKTLYDFQTDLRKDSRWLKTQNAQDSAMATTHKILSDFGLVN